MALELAVGMRDNECIRMLLDYMTAPERVSQCSATIMKAMKLAKGLNARDEHREEILQLFNKWRKWPLHLAVLDDGAYAVQQTLMEGVDVNAKCPNGLTALGFAVTQDKVEAVRALLDYMTAPERVSQYSAIIIEAMRLAKDLRDAHRENREKILQLFSKWPLHLAILDDGANAIRQALREGADVNAKCLNGPTALGFAVTQDKVEAVGALLDYMTAPERIISDARTVRIAKMLADRLPEGQRNRTTIQRFLAEAEAKVNTDLKVRLPELAKGSDVNAVKQILAAGVDANTLALALRNAVNRGDYNITKALLDHMITPGRIDTCVEAIRTVKGQVEAWTRNADRAGFRRHQNLFRDVEERITRAQGEKEESPRDLPPSAPNFDATAALFRAVIDFDTEGIQNALDDGAPVNVKNNGGYTPLHHAIVGRNKATISMLLKYGADVAAKNDKGETALQLLDIGGIEGAKVLLDHVTDPGRIGAYVGVLMEALRWKQKDSTWQYAEGPILQLLQEATAKTLLVEPVNYPVFDDEKSMKPGEFVLNVGTTYPIAAQRGNAIDPRVPVAIQAYMSLSMEIQDYLQRLGIVVLDRNTIRFTKELHLIYVIHEPTVEQTVVWRWVGDLQGPCAVRIFSHPAESVQLLQLFDAPAVGGLRVASFPGGWFKRSLPCTAENAGQFRLRLPRWNPNAPREFSALMMTSNRIYVTTEIVLIRIS
jgi:ankyrin repeat protein